MGLVKKCRHGRGKSGRARLRAWRTCGCTWYGDLRADGVRVYPALGPDEGEARAAYARLVAEREAGRLHVTTREAPTVGAHAERWATALEHAGGHKPRSVNAYRSRARLIAGWFGDMPLAALTSRHVAEFLADVRANYSDSYASNLRATLGAMLQAAAEAGAIPTNPAAGVRVPRARADRQDADNPNHVPLADVERVLGALPAGPVADMATLALLSGLRLGELVVLTAGAYDPERGAVAVAGTGGRDGLTGTPKTRSSRRVVPLAGEARGIAERYAAGKPADAPLFGVPYWTAADRLRDTLEALGLYVPRRGWHMFRHANAVLRERAGESLRSAAAALGHGGHTAQTLGYGWRAETGAAAQLDHARAAARRGNGAEGAGGEPPAAG